MVLQDMHVPGTAHYDWPGSSMECAACTTPPWLNCRSGSCGVGVELLEGLSDAPIQCFYLTTAVRHVTPCPHRHERAVRAPHHLDYGSLKQRQGIPNSTAISWRLPNVADFDGKL
eukprot:TRINITY_DN4221_c1_g1_i1.p2 TRINITY_DN4221_c1_g1~~TRINITY_DN4221_c1_g1_i1.p2  ORF type:complete len:115 (-),score=1.38 TRINITY_DN4221_c1_g1_i1:131-475(-)